MRGLVTILLTHTRLLVRVVFNVVNAITILFVSCSYLCAIPSIILRIVPRYFLLQPVSWDLHAFGLSCQIFSCVSCTYVASKTCTRSFSLLSSYFCCSRPRIVIYDIWSTVMPPIVVARYCRQAFYARVRQDVRCLAIICNQHTREACPTH